MTEITPQQITDYAAGKRELWQLVGIDPEYHAQLKGRAQYFLDSGRPERALIMLEMLEELDRTDLLPSLLAVEILLACGEASAAEEKLNALSERFPDHPDVAVARALLLLQGGELVRAAELLKSVIDRDPQAETDAGKRAQAVVARANAVLG